MRAAGRSRHPRRYPTPVSGWNRNEQGGAGRGGVPIFIAAWHRQLVCDTRGTPGALISLGKFRMHWAQTKFDRSVILLDQIVEGLSRSHLGPLVALMAEDLPRPPDVKVVMAPQPG